LGPGDTVLAIDDLYGGTRRLFENIKTETSNLKFIYKDLSDSELIDNLNIDDIKMIWIETPTNPMLKLVDLAAISNLAKNINIITVVDNTFCSPFIQRPIDLGIDIVIHSATKYLNGHSDIVGGVVICKDSKLSEKIAYIQNAVGAIQGPFDAYLALRGLKTLSLRMERHCYNALKIADYLSKNKLVKKVYYPGLKNHPNHELAKKQMLGFGGIVSCIIVGGINGAKTILDTCQIFKLAESLGGVESLIEHPGIMTHASVPEDIRKNLGIEDGLIRLSVGIEDIDDLIFDLDRGFKAIERL